MEATGLVAQDRQKLKWREFFENRTVTNLRERDTLEEKLFKRLKA